MPSLDLVLNATLSLTTHEEERQVLEAVPSTDIWTGGNLCPDSPAPQDSMWTDGSANKETHFARVSGLEGDRCCVKAGRRGWKGEPCSVLLYGVSQTFEDGNML